MTPSLSIQRDDAPRLVSLAHTGDVPPTFEGQLMSHAIAIATSPPCDPAYCSPAKRRKLRTSP